MIFTEKDIARAKANMAECVCEFKGERGEKCERCNTDITGAVIFFISDGGWDGREGSYFCATCTERFFGLRRDLEAEALDRRTEAEAKRMGWI